MGKTKYIKKIYFKLEEIRNLKKYLKNIKFYKYLTVLNLHKISDENNPFYPATEPKLFEELLSFIVKEFNVITFKEIKEFKNSSKPNIILSFDDGFYDYLEYAVPIMERYGVKSNQNIIPSCVKSGLPHWDVQLGDFLNQAPSSLINELKLPNFSLKLSRNNRAQFGLELTKYLKQFSKEKRKPLWEEIEKLMSRAEIKYTKMLSINDIKYISKTHEIGAHSYEHDSMALESDDFFINDFKKCRNFFKQELQTDLDIYAFPSGSYNKFHLEYLIQEKVKYILLVNEKYSNYSDNKYNRFTFYGNSVSEIKMRAVGWQRGNKI